MRDEILYILKYIYKRCGWFGYEDKDGKFHSFVSSDGDRDNHSFKIEASSPDGIRHYKVIIEEVKDECEIH